MSVKLDRGKMSKYLGKSDVKEKKPFSSYKIENIIRQLMRPDVSELLFERSKSNKEKGIVNMAKEIVNKAKEMVNKEKRISERIPDDKPCEILPFSDKEAIYLPSLLINELKNIKDRLLSKEITMEITNYNSKYYTQTNHMSYFVFK